MSHYIPTNLDACLVSIPHHVIETIKVGRTNLKIPDIYRSLSFYRDLLGFQLMTFRLKFPLLFKDAAARIIFSIHL